MVLIILKIGGSILTNKDDCESSVNQVNLKRIAREIKSIFNIFKHILLKACADFFANRRPYAM